MGRALLQASVGIMLLAQAKASGIIALTESRVSRSVSGECLVLSGDEDRRERLWATHSAPAPQLYLSPLKVPGSISYIPLFMLSAWINRSN